MDSTDRRIVICILGAVVVCGGLGGVMEAVCRGAQGAGGRTVGILPGDDRHQANPYVDVAVATGLGEARNVVVVRTADVVVAVGGEFGTLSEIALAIKLGKPVVGLGTWRLRQPEGRRVPIILVNSKFWGGLLDWVKGQLLSDGMIGIDDPGLIQVIDDPQAVVDAIFDHYQFRGFEPSPSEREAELAL